jgi:hypothetical protein
MKALRSLILTTEEIIFGDSLPYKNFSTASWEGTLITLKCL